MVNTGGCAGDLTITVSQIDDYYFLNATIDCNPVEYIWNEDESLTSASLILFELDGEYTLDVLCANGCSYTASLGLSCTEGTPCDDDNDPTTIELYNELCECIKYICPDADNDGQPDDCDDDQSCDGNIDIVHNEIENILTVDIAEVECPDDITYLWSNGATTASISYANQSASYSVTVTCSTGCQYSKMKAGDTDGCVIGEPCPSATSCTGEAFLDENCNCIDVDPEYSFSTNFEVLDYPLGLGKVTVTIQVDEEICEEPLFEWNTGQTDASIIITNLEATYVVTVTCDACEFTAFYNLNAQDCVIGAPCIDGDTCTVFDVYDSECNCIGTEVEAGECYEDPCTPGLMCDDEDPCTYFDITWGDFCCIGFLLVNEEGDTGTDCSDDPCIIGAICNDGDPCTIGDVYNANCDCIGVPLLDGNGDPAIDCEEGDCADLATIIISPTANYNEVILSAGITSCDSDISYEWSNGSTIQNIIVNSNTGTYSVIITCGVCTYTAYYNTNGCLVGLPCNDGLDCTENDEVQENCKCMGEPIEDLEITFTEEEVVYETSCDYKTCLPVFDVFSEFTITSINVVLPDGSFLQLNQGMNNQGYDFPYCYNPLLSTCPPLPSILKLAEDISNWLGEGSSSSVSTLVPSSPSCPSNKVFIINNSTVQFTSINGYNDIKEQLTFPFSSNCDNAGTTPIGINVQANIDCVSYDENQNVIPNQYLWSDGTNNQTVFIPFDDNGDPSYCLQVTVICANGCIYTETFGDNCEDCIYGYLGAPCDDSNECTIGDSVTEDCECVGLPLPDSDGDGNCDEIDICPLGDDNIDLDDNGIPDACEEGFDCTNELTGYITSEVVDESCTYCMFLNDPIFSDESNEEDIYLQSMSIWEDGVPKLLDQGTSGFSFPYLIDKSSNLLLPSSFMEDLNEYMGDNGSMLLFSGDFYGCLQKTTENGIEINNPQEGPNLVGFINLPSILKEMNFAWGGNNTFTKSFYNPTECEPNPYTLHANLNENCGGEPTYEWSNGSTGSSIQVPSLLPIYTVTITCGICQAIVNSEPSLGEGCEVESECDGLDICGNLYDGFYDAYCNCIPLDDTQPDCGDDCDEEFEQIHLGVTICCNAAPPSMTYEVAPEIDVFNSCFEFNGSDIITGIQIEGVTINENNNPGGFFDFPYCIESNCSYYGEDIDIPYELKSYKVFAYDLQRWARANEFQFNVSADGGAYELCDECGNGKQIFINGRKTGEKIFIFIDYQSVSMNTCEGKADGGYYVVFEEYTGCNVKKLFVLEIDQESSIDVTDINGNIDLGSYEFGPVPHTGVGFRAIVECTSGCIYNIVSPGADCIVGDPCDSPDVCATETYTGYDFEDCVCNVLASNDIDEDGVCDDEDECMPEDSNYNSGYNVIYDDNIDNDQNGIPDGCQEGVCGSEICTSTGYLQAGNCVDSNPCGVIRNILVELPDGTQVNLTDQTQFSFPYNMNLLGGALCVKDEENLLEEHLRDWLTSSGYLFTDVTVRNGQIRITDSNVKFINMLNICRDVFPFNTNCVPPFCNYSHLHSHSFIAEPCAELQDIMVEIDGVPISLRESYPELNFPYCFNYIYKACNSECTHLTELEADLASALGVTVNVSADGTASASTIAIAISSTNIVFRSATYNKNDSDFNQFDCVNGCDDGWDCTINDQYDENCNCVGIFIDSDNDQVCDPLDQCPGFPDYLDSDNDGIPDCLEDEISIDCEPEDIPYCDFIKNFLPCAEGKIMINDLSKLTNGLKEKFSTIPNMLDYLPYPLLANELEGFPNKYDDDMDGIVDMLDPNPCMYNSWPMNPSDLTGYMCTDCITGKSFDDGEYLKERASVINMFLYTVNPGVLVGTNDDDSGNPIFSACIDEVSKDWGLVPIQYNESGYIFSNKINCYVYFELDCNCNCIVVESQAINYADDCDLVVVGETCTQDPDEGATEGYHYIKCPPEGTDACDTYVIVANPAYDPYNPVGGVYPCLCEQQFDSNGQPTIANDIDNDGVCDILDVCGPDFNEDGTPILTGSDEYLDSFNDLLDSDGDGVPDCLDSCEGVDYAATQDEADEKLQEYLNDNIDANDDIIIIVANKEGYSTPSGPGDICDDGNSCTYDDVITADCKCQGVYIDLDDDGVYDCEECEYIETSEGSGMYACEGCQGEVEVDAIGNVVEDPGASGANEVAHTWSGCDVCPGIPDGDPMDIGGQYEGDLPMDYNDNGLPDCIDPPFKPICPYEFEIADGVGLVLFFETDDLDEGDYPEPISFQGITASNAELVYHDYLTVDYAREVKVEVEDEITGELIEKTITEVYYTIPYTSFERGEYNQATIIYSDHQTCIITDDDIVPLSCPYSISIKYGKISFNQSDLGEIDLSELLGTYTIKSGITEVIVEPDISTDFDITNALIKLEIEPELLDGFSDPFSGTITLPSGLECEFTTGVPEGCEVTVEGSTVSVTIGTPCDDGKECTHHDKYIDNGGDFCECVGELRPDSDIDGFCDAIDPCPEDWNEMPASGKVEDIDDCPCPMLELSTLESELAGLQNGNDFYVYFGSDLSGFSDITIEADNGQDDPFDPMGGKEVDAVSPIVIGNIQGGFTYTITITAFCENGEPQIMTFEVDVPFGDTPILCGLEMEPFDINSYTYLTSLSTSETFSASDIDITVLRSEGSNGSFSGKGYIKLPYFNQARLNVTFNNIKISAARQMIDGYVDVNGFGVAILGDDISDAINNSLDNIIGVLEDISDLLDEVTIVLEGIEELYSTTNELVDEETKNCITKNTDKLEELKEYIENNPNLSEVDLANAKQSIELVAAELKSCQEDYDAQIAAILNKLYNIYVKAFSAIQAECDNSDYISNYNMVSGLPDEKLEDLINNLNIEVPGATESEEVFFFDKVTKFSIDSNWDVNDPDMDLTVDYFNKTLIYSRCIFVNTVLSNEEGFSKDVSITLFKAFLSASIEIGFELASELKSDKQPDKIYLDNKELIDNLLSKFLSYSIYQTKK